MMEMNLDAQAERMRALAATSSLDAFLDCRMSAEALSQLDELVGLIRKQGGALGALVGPEIASRFSSDVTWDRLRQLANARYGEDIAMPHVLLEVILRVFRPEGIGVWVGTQVVRKMMPQLCYDKDGLVIGPEPLDFRKEGLLTDGKLLIYENGLGGYSSGGFLDLLLRAKLLLSPSHFGLRLKENLLFDSSYYADMFTRAFIRGPRGLSVDMLQSRSFPSDPSGTVTEHRRVGQDGLRSLFPLERLEVMWSARDGLKTVQIEELVPPDSFRKRDGMVSNRYIHAQWNPATETFIHFDGAFRQYEPSNYEARRATDMRRFKGKADRYKKVFRIDAPLSLRGWGELTSRYFDGNELVMEYLGGEQDEG